MSFANVDQTPNRRQPANTMYLKIISMSNAAIEAEQQILVPELTKSRKTAYPLPHHNTTPN